MAESNYKFTFLGNGAYSNRGCEAIVRGTTTLLRKEFGICKFNSIYMDPDLTHPDLKNECDPDIIHFPITQDAPTHERWFSPAWFARQTRRIFSKTPAKTIYPKVEKVLRENPSQATLLLGGDNATPGATGNPEFAFKMLEIARQQGAPVIYWGASIGPFTGDDVFERWMVEQLSSIALICARETKTYHYLKSLGLKKDNLLLVADPAFFLNPEPFQLPDHIMKLLKGTCIGINFSPLVGKNYASMDEWATRVRNSLEQLAHQFDGPILLIPHVLKKNNNDCEFMQSILEDIAEINKGNIYLIDQALSAAQYKYLISQMQVFCGARTHATIAAVSTCVPTLFVGYSSKAQGIARDTYDHLEWFIDGNNLEPVEFVSKVLSMAANRSEIKLQLKQRLSVFEERSALAAQVVRKIL